MKSAVLALTLVGAHVAAASSAAAQDPSDVIYAENTFGTFTLTLSATDWSVICNDGNGAGDQWKRGTMTWTNGSITETVQGVGVKRSGQYSAGIDTPKPGIRISFNEFEFQAQKRKWRGVNRIKLDSMIGNTDLTMMRDRLAYWTFSQFGAPASRACHARLMVNGDYKGVYTVEEPVKEPFAMRRWGEHDGNLYEIGYGANRPYHWVDSNPASYVPSKFVPETNYPGGDYRDIVQLVNIVNNYPTNQIPTLLNGHINLNSFYSHVACQVMIADGDGLAHWSGGGHVNNHSWYHRTGTNKLELIKWDPGASQGLYDSANGFPKGQSPMFYRFDGVPLVRWLLTDPTGNAALKAKLSSIVNGPYATNVLSRIDFIYNQIQAAAHADRYKGISPNSGSPAPLPNGFTNAEFDAARGWLKDWYSRRIAYIRSQIGGTTLPTVTIAATDNAAAEPSSIGVFTVTRTGSTSASLNVSLSRSGTAGSADCNAMPATLTIPAGSASATITLTPVDDTLVEGPETVILTIASSGSYTVGTSSSATVTIADNDTATLPTVTIAATDNAAAEPSSIGVFTVTRTGSTSASLNVSLSRSGTAGSADCNAMPATLTIPAASATATITLTPVDDTLVEGPETVILTIASSGSYTVGTSSSATVTIADNDTATLPTVTIAATDNAAAEPSSIGVFTVTRTGSTSASLNVSLSRSGTAGSADCNAMPATLTIPAASATATITLTPVDDTLVEGPETVILTITPNAALYIVGTASNATVTIADNDTAALPTVTIVATDPDAAEPTSTGFFTVTRTGATTAALAVVRVRSGTATSGNDFAGLPSPITIPAGQASVTVTVTPIDDTTPEGPETVILTISPSSAYTVGTASTAIVTIADNDTAALPTVTIVATDPDAAEPTSTGFFTVTRTGATTAALAVVRVRSGTATSGNDFAGLPSPITIPAGQASVTVTVTPVDDAAVEGPETVILTLSPNAAYTVGAASSATVTIADDDTALPTVTITATDGNAAEPANVGVFTVTRTGPTTGALTVPRVRTGTATSGADFTALPSPITIPAGRASVTVTVTPIDDTTAEGNETVILTISPDPVYTVGTASSATVTIADDDSATGGLSATYYDNPDFTGASVTRTDSTIDFNWADQAPAPGIGPDTFSVRWTGRVRAQYGETYTFYTFTNDGVRLWVEGELLVDKWVQQSGGIEWSAQVALEAGHWYTVQMDYYENMGNSLARLLWSSPSIPKQVIPQTALDPALGAPDSRDNDGDGIPNDTDFDDDNDGIPDLQDPDRDGDTLTNLTEHASGSDPNDRNSPNAGGVPAGVSDGDNPNGHGPFLINDKCSGSILIGDTGGYMAAALLLGLLSIGGIRRRR